MPPLSTRNEAPDEDETIRLSAVQSGKWPAELTNLARRKPWLFPTVKVEALPTLQKRQVVASTAQGAVVAGAGDLASAILRYLTNVIMTHIVAPGVYGVFVVAYTVVTVLGYTAKLGLDSATLRFLSAYRAQNKRALAVGLVSFATRLVLISGIIAALIFLLLSSFLAEAIYHKPIYALPFKEAALLIPLIGMQLVVASGLQALKAIKWKVCVDRLIQPGLTLCMLVVFYLFGLRLEALLLAATCGYLASSITGYFLLGKALRRVTSSVVPQYERKIWLRFALPMSFNSMIRNILNSTDILFLGALALTSQVGLYGAADRVSYFVVAPLIALNVIFSPVISEYHARNQREQLASMFKVVTRWSFSLSLPIFLCCLIFSREILGIFGEKYIAAGPVLALLAFGNLVDAGAGSVNYLLAMTGRPRIILANTVATVIVNITLILFLVPRFAIIGAAAAAALTVILLNATGLIEVYFLMRMHPYRWDMLKPLMAGAVASLAGLLLTRFIHVGCGFRAFPKTLGLIILFLLVYTFVLAVMHLSEEDMMVIDTIRARLGLLKKQAV